MERVKWTDRIRNEALLEEMDEERMRLKLIRKRKGIGWCKQEFNQTYYNESVAVPNNCPWNTLSSAAILDSTDSSAVAAVKSLSSEQLLEDILFIDSNFKIVSKSIILLESSKLQLSEILNIVDKVSQTVIQNNNSLISEKVKLDCDLILELILQLLQLILLLLQLTLLVITTNPTAPPTNPSAPPTNLTAPPTNLTAPPTNPSASLINTTAPPTNPSAHPINPNAFPTNISAPLTNPTAPPITRTAPTTPTTFATHLKQKNVNYSSAEALRLIEEITKVIHQESATPSSNRVKQKLSSVLCKNGGYAIFCDIKDMLAGKKSTDTPGVAKTDFNNLVFYRFAPITSCDVERSFSQYKFCLADNRRKFSFETLRIDVIVSTNLPTAALHRSARASAICVGVHRSGLTSLQIDSDDRPDVVKKGAITGAAEKFHISKRTARCIWLRGRQSLESGSMLITKLIPAINAKWSPGPHTGRIQVSVQQDNTRLHIAPNDSTWMDAAAASGITLELVCQPPNSLDMNLTRDKLNNVFLTLQSHLIEIMKVNDGNNKIPHMQKGHLDHLNILPSRLECPRNIYDEATVALQQ
ncbi:hypothetical protein ANN_09673 [Periplaneta americana]|uniref:Uncharacterized protein n=1 Tax=Periplaneta americana TaxID=6978 RepID=A0ABQ8TNF8_PERAM|nr:hypothetical protein ANN_09673 [Periplaneta americana]